MAESGRKLWALILGASSGFGEATALARPETHWITGNVIGVDGGENIAS
jgi:NADP-dependent 3-hydroxy acid dehydrogenase YdfG